MNFRGKKNYGEFSGKAWASGYLGGIFCLIIILVLFLIPEKSFFSLNEFTIPFFIPNTPNRGEG